MISTSRKPTPISRFLQPALLCCAILVLPACNWISLIGVNSSGVEGNGSTSMPSLSADGRYVAFRSAADNLVPSDTNGASDAVIRALRKITVTSVVPDMLPIGATTSITISGANFQAGSQRALAAQLSNMVIVDENIITVDVTVPEDKASGAVNVAVSLDGTGPGTITGAAGFCMGCVTFF